MLRAHAQLHVQAARGLDDNVLRLVLP